MRKALGILALVIGLLPVAGALCAGGQEIDDDLRPTKRLFPGIGPGLHALHHAANGNFYVLAAPVGVAVFDDKGKQISIIGPPPPAPVTNKAGRSAIAAAVDCDVDAQGNVYIADRSYNLVTEFSPDGKQIRSFPVDSLVSLAVLPNGEIAVTTQQSAHHVVIYSQEGKVVREFGDFESLSSRADLDRMLNVGRVSADPQGHIYFGFSYMPESLVRKFDKSGKAEQDFVFTGVDAYPEASATRKEIDRVETTTEPPVFRQILTAFGVDPVKGDVWMAMHNTLVHFDSEGIRRSEYQMWTVKGLPIDATVIVVEKDRLLVGSDPLGVYEFLRPDRQR